MLLHTFSVHAKVVSRDAKEMTKPAGHADCFVSCKSGKFELFLVEKIHRFLTDEKSHFKCPTSLSVFTLLRVLLFSLTVSHCGYP